jgi:Mg2+/Co2+ transporter CorB
VRLVGIPVETEIDELRQVVRTEPHTRYPVYASDLDHIVGSVHIKTLLRHLIAGRKITARDARPVPYIPATMAMDDVLAAMRRHSAQMAVVMDEHGGTAGLITIEDLFEEVVGEIEEGRERAPIVREADGRLLVGGTVRLKDAGGKARRFAGTSRCSVRQWPCAEGTWTSGLRRRRRHLEWHPGGGEIRRGSRRWRRLGYENLNTVAN